MDKPETKIGPRCQELDVTRQTLYRQLALDESLQEHGPKLMRRSTRHGT
jgi:hypothetical protein